MNPTYNNNYFTQCMTLHVPFSKTLPQFPSYLTLSPCDVAEGLSYRDGLLAIYMSRSHSSTELTAIILFYKGRVVCNNVQV